MFDIGSVHDVNSRSSKSVMFAIVSCLIWPSSSFLSLAMYVSHLLDHPADVPEAYQQRRGSWGDVRDAPDFNDPSNDELSAMVSDAASNLNALEKFLAIFRRRREVLNEKPARRGLARFTRQTSNIVVECCLSPCSITDIMGYCHAGYTPPSNSTLVRSHLFVCCHLS